jgi:hypothetical protein
MYDSQLLLKNVYYHQNEKLLVKLEKKYEENENLIFTTEWQNDETITPISFFEYTFEDNLEMIFKMSGRNYELQDHQKYEYLSYDDSICQITLNIDNSIAHYVYSQDHQRTFRNTIYSSNKDIDSESKYTYDAENRMTSYSKKENYFEKLQDVEKDDYNYFENGHIIEKFRTNDKGKLVLKEKHTYNLNGDVVLIEYRNKKKVSRTESFEISYDDNGNWITMITRENNIPTKIEKREFSYY